MPTFAATRLVFDLLMEVRGGPIRNAIENQVPWTKGHLKEYQMGEQELVPELELAQEQEQEQE